MYGSREIEIALITLSVAITACRIADYGEGIMFSVLTSGAAFFAVIFVYELADGFSTKRSPARQSTAVAVRGLTLSHEHDRVDRRPDRRRSTTSSL